MAITIGNLYRGPLFLEIVWYRVMTRGGGVHIERLSLTNFRCFGSETVTIEFDERLSALVGANGSGKTAALLGMLRLFGFNHEQRRVQVQDFHVPADENPDHRPTERHLAVEVILGFPELEDDDDDDTDSVPEFFRQMAADENGVLKCLIRLEADWQADGSVEGAISESRRVVRTLDHEYQDDDWSELHPTDRARVQVIYVPPARDGAQQLTAFLRGRLWRAAQWSQSFRDDLADTAQDLNTKFGKEPPVAAVQKVLTRRWNQLHAAGTDAFPSFRPVSQEFARVVDRADLFFEPTETGQERRAIELSDGQRSLLHIALTATALDIEGDIAAGKRTKQFDGSEMGLPTLTILVVEEPENSLSPFYLSRIVGQMLEIGSGRRAQMVLSSHSPSVLGRIEPEAVRHFRFDSALGVALVNRILLPDNSEDAAKYVREAVRAFPELYFARFAVFGEGSSEQVAIPILAAALDVQIDRSFVAVVPLGGRHVNHLWRLVNQLSIPYATLLDLDWGREGAGIERVKTIDAELAGIGINPCPSDAAEDDPAWDIANISADNVDDWVTLLRDYDVFFCDPLDLDWELLTAFFDDYTKLAPGDRGPHEGDAFEAVLGRKGDKSFYADKEEELRWYRYLFLGRSKPSTHLRVLTGIERHRLRAGMPEVLVALIERIEQELA